MSHIFFREELESVATFWRIMRRDGCTLGFTSHDRDLWFDGVVHRAAPGMVPSSIRKTADFSADSVEVQGVLSHDTIRTEDLAAGRYDQAAISVGAVDWQTLVRATLYNGTVGAVAQQSGSFTADLRSSKAQLARDFIPRTSPTCRARFCGPGCTLSAARFSTQATIAAIDQEANALVFEGIDPQIYVHGELRLLAGPQSGIRMQIINASDAGLVIDIPLSAGLKTGSQGQLREGCDHTIATCANRFGNAVNFEGEPFLPGNDLLARYPIAR